MGRLTDDRQRSRSLFERRLPELAEEVTRVPVKRKRLNDDLSRVAKAIYETHWREGSPTWIAASDEVKDWVRAQACNAIEIIRNT